MAWRSWILGVVVLTVGAYWAVKIQHIQLLKAEIVRLEAGLSKGQEVWRNYPPLTAREKSKLQEAEDRLFRMLPNDKDIPPLLLEISGLAMEHKLVDVSFNTGDKAAPPGTGPSMGGAGAGPARAVPKSASPVASGTQAGSGSIESAPVKLAFAGDYRDIAYFLAALEKLPRLVTIQSLKVQRALPLQQAEVILHAYYQKGKARP